MAKPKAKITTVTKAAKKIIREYLDTPDIALFIAASFLEVRLRTVLRIYFKIRGKNARILLDEMSLAPLIRLAYALEIISKSEHDAFIDLAKKRGDLGHDTTRWRLRYEKEDPLYRRLSKSALDFVVSYGTEEQIKSHLSSMPRVAPPESRKGLRP